MERDVALLGGRSGRAGARQHWAGADQLENVDQRAVRSDCDRIAHAERAVRRLSRAEGAELGSRKSGKVAPRLGGYAEIGERILSEVAEQPISGRWLVYEGRDFSALCQNAVNRQRP
jgi:hypothetical protein